ncbi:MAG: hypothetical protein IPJ34_37345 [Myxococcales bacterium]|nr:hypothetical protein [Myxococcales bacterium]
MGDEFLGIAGDRLLFSDRFNGARWISTYGGPSHVLTSFRPRRWAIGDGEDVLTLGYADGKQCLLRVPLDGSGGSPVACRSGADPFPAYGAFLHNGEVYWESNAQIFIAPRMGGLVQNGPPVSLGFAIGKDYRLQIDSIEDVLKVTRVDDSGTQQTFLVVPPDEYKSFFKPTPIVSGRQAYIAFGGTYILEIDLDSGVSQRIPSGGDAWIIFAQESSGWLYWLSIKGDYSVNRFEGQIIAMRTPHGMRVEATPTALASFSLTIPGSFMINQFPMMFDDSCAYAAFNTGESKGEALVIKAPKAR